MIKQWPRFLIGRYVLNSLAAIIIIGGVASIVNIPAIDRKWATLDDMLVDWDAKNKLLAISVRVTKRQECRRIVVNKLVRPIADGDVVQDPVASVNGRLFAEIQAAPIGSKAVFDKARLVSPTASVPSDAPSIALLSGQYMVSMVALCELPETMGQLHGTDPIQSILIVP